MTALLRARARVQPILLSYTKKAWLNDKPLDRFWIHHNEIAGGGTLRFEMGADRTILARPLGSRGSHTKTALTKSPESLDSENQIRKTKLAGGSPGWDARLRKT